MFRDEAYAEGFVCHSGMKELGVVKIKVKNMAEIRERENRMGN